MLAYSWVRVVGAALLVPIGLRAILRTVRFLVSPAMRQLAVSWSVPRPSISGPLETVALDEVTRFEVGHAAGDLYFSAHDARGKVTHLVTLEHASEPQASGVSMATDRREGVMNVMRRRTTSSWRRG